jgi:hypothetical protein
MGCVVVIAQNGAERLNSSVLIKMSRDCTALPQVHNTCTVPHCRGIPYMQKSNKSNKSSISNKKATGKSSGIKRGIPVGVSSKGGASLQVDYVVSSREHMATLSGNSAPFLLLGSRMPSWLPFL